MMNRMKTTMTYMAALLMLGAVAVSCNKIDNQDRTPEENTQVTSPVEMTFTATMAAKDVSTRAVDADGVTTWVVDEKIAVYYQKSDDSYGKATANVDAVNAGVATISASLTGAKNGGTVKFVYPASLVNATGDDIDVAKLTSNQHGTIADISTNFDAATGSGTLLTDGSTCGTAATVTLTNQVLIGKFTPKFDGAAIDGITTLTVSDGTNTYTIKPSSGTFGTTGIYVAMLPVSSQVVSLTATTALANYIYPGKSVTLAAGKLYNNLDIAITMGTAGISGGGSQEWVQLWPGGPKWARFNVGSTITSYENVTAYTNPDVIGGYYSYRGRYDSSADARGTGDTATYVWGGGWSMPTGSQEQALLANCTWTYCDGSSVQYVSGCTLAGWKVEGKEARYTGNSIFLPFSGIRDQNNSKKETVGTRGCYWSSTSGAYYINLTSSDHSYVSANEPHGLSARAIFTGEYAE